MDKEDFRVITGYLRGGNCNNGAQCPGALNLNNAPSNYNWNIVARAAQISEEALKVLPLKTVHNLYRL